MLKKLFVQNIFLIENLELEFTSGLNVLTGETGAGKSILLDCLGYLLGKKNTRIERLNYYDQKVHGEAHGGKKKRKAFEIVGNFLVVNLIIMKHI